MDKQNLKQIQNNIKDCQEARADLVKELKEMFMDAIKDDKNFCYYEITQNLIDTLEKIQEVNEIHKDNLSRLLKLQ